MANRQFFRPLPRKGFPLYWILLVYLVAGYFFTGIENRVGGYNYRAEDIAGGCR